MLFIGIALLVAVGLGLLVSTDAGSVIGLVQAQTAQLIVLLVILIVFAGGTFMRRHRLGELLGGLLMWAGLFAVALVTYAYRDELLSVAGRVAGEITPGVAIVDAERGTATFRRGIAGHFEIETDINGHLTPMVFDTGASAVVLTRDDAQAAGIDVGALRYTIPVSTANGMGMAARTQLDQVVVGGIVRRDISAFVADEGALETSLLGMTFLETLSRYTVTSNSLELTD
jgi:aspartyl protease family protein